MKNKLYRGFSLALWVFILIMIFFLSQQDGSDSTKSSGFVLRLLESLFNRELNEAIIREGAHFTEYLILGTLSVNVGYAFKKHLQPFAALLFGAVYALSDEIHQIFIPGRACQLFDWAVDTAGVLCGVFLFTFCASVFIKRQKRRARSC